MTTATQAISLSGTDADETAKTLPKRWLHGNPDQAAQAIEENLQYGKQELLSPRRR